MSQYTHRTVIVPAPFQQLAQGLCEAAAEGDAGKRMFTTPLSTTGQEPATHYISAGYIEDAFAELLPCTTVTPAIEEGEPDVITTRPGNVAVVEGMAAQAGVQVPKGAIAALLGAIDVSGQEPFAAMGRMGLKLVQLVEVLTP